jgi:hypothetical protein
VRDSNGYIASRTPAQILTDINGETKGSAATAESNAKNYTNI